MPTLDLTLLEKRWEERLPLLLDSFTEITPEAAQRLTELPVPLKLDGLHRLSEDAAKILAQSSQGTLSLSSLSEISDQSAGHLSAYRGVLALNGLKQLSRSLASRLGDFEGCLQLNGLTRLDEAAAADLVENIKLSISLNGLSEASTNLLQQLQKGCSWYLELDGLRNLSVASADELSKCHASLSLNGLLMLSDNVAQCLVREYYERRWLSLNGVTKIADNVASTLGHHEGRLCLNGLTEISDTGIEKLCSTCSLLELDSLRRWSERISAAFQTAYEKWYARYHSRYLSYQSCIMNRSSPTELDEKSLIQSIVEYIATSLPDWSCAEGTDSSLTPSLLLLSKSCGVAETFGIFVSNKRGMVSVDLLAGHLCEESRVFHDDFCVEKMHQLGRDVAAIARFIHTTIDADLTYSVDWDTWTRIQDPLDAVDQSDSAAVRFLE